jgi:hypothetical protein
MAIPAGAGIGVEIDRDYLRELTVRETALAPPQARAGRMHQGQ